MTEVVVVSSGCTRREGSGGGKGGGGGGDQEQQQQASVIELVLSALRKSVVACTVDESEDVVTTAVQQKMEIGYPTDVKHITHVTFDRFNGFLGLPVELEVEIPTPVPSASASVFGVSPESMQCCYDSRGNSVPKILLLMQERLYSQDGLKAEGIFRINPENSQEEYVRDQLNKGIVPDDIDVHCLAGLIKAWFRELPSGVLDGLLPEQVLRCSVEEEFVELTNLLQPTQSALLNWAVELMADVVEEEEMNKMNARNIAMVFAPNMTQMSDPLTALMHAVQVINFLKALILKTLRDREDAAMEEESWSSSSSSPASDSYHFCIQRANDYVNGEQTVSSDDEAGGQISDRNSSDGEQTVSSDDEAGGQISDRNSSDDNHGGDDLALLNDKDNYDGSDYSDRTSEGDDNDDYSSSDEEIAKMKEKHIFLIEWKVEEDDDGDDEATTTSFSDLHVSGTIVSGSASSKQESCSTVTDEEEDSDRSVDKCVVVPVRPEKQDGGSVDVEIVKCLLEP